MFAHCHWSATNTARLLFPGTIKMSHSPVSNGGPLSHSSSSIPATPSLPARQEVTSGAGVHGDWCSGAAGLPAPVEQRPTSLSGVQLLHAAGLQAAGVPEPHTPAAAAACCATGAAQTFMLLCLSRHSKIKALVRNCVQMTFVVVSRARLLPHIAPRTPHWTWTCLWIRCSSISASMPSTLWTLLCAAGNRLIYTLYSYNFFFLNPPLLWP